MRWCLCLVLFACSGEEVSESGTAPPELVVESFEPFETVTLLKKVTHDTFEDRAVMYWVPESPMGLVFVFQGATGNTTSLQQLEWIDLYREFQARKIAFVAVESEDQESGKWNTSVEVSTNQDFSRLADLREELVANTALTSNTPVGAVGFSSGGHMASSVAVMGLEEGWDFRTWVSHNSKTHEEPTLPAIFVDGRNDDVAGKEMLGVQQQCADDGLGCEYWLVLEEPIVPLYFARLPQVDEEESQAAVLELKDFHLIDGEGKRLISDSAVESALVGYESASQRHLVAKLSDQIRVAWATHRFNAMFKVQEADWFYEHFLGRPK